MSQETVTLHLSKTNSSSHFSSFDGLMGERLDPSCRTNLEFVFDHVTEALIVNDPKENISLHQGPRNSRIHRFIAVIVVASLQQLLSKVINCSLLFVEPKFAEYSPSEKPNKSESETRLKTHWKGVAS